MIVEVENVTKNFLYINPDPNQNKTDMWFNYLLGMLGGSDSPFAAKRKKIVALDNVSFNVKEGEFFGILGMNGAGKSTLVKVLSTILSPNEGNVRINGYNSKKNPAEVRASLTVVPSAGWLAFDSQLSIKENVSFWARLYGLDKELAKKQIQHALNVVGLSEWYKETPSNLSSGMRQRLAIAKGIVFQSPLFILDEPTANIDPVSATQIRTYLRNELNRKLGQTVILTTHNMEEAEQLCDRVLIIEQGKIIACDKPSSLVQTIKDSVWEVDVFNVTNEMLRQIHACSGIIHVQDYLNENGTGRFRIISKCRKDELITIFREYNLKHSEVQLGKARLEDLILIRGMSKHAIK